MAIMLVKNLAHKLTTTKLPIKSLPVMLVSVVLICIQKKLNPKMLEWSANEKINIKIPQQKLFQTMSNGVIYA